MANEPPNNAAYYAPLVAKWATLPADTTANKLAGLNAQTVPGVVTPTIVETYKIYNVINPTEFSALTNANQQLVRDILSLGRVDASPGTSVRTRLLAIFAAGSATRTALAALAAPFESPTIPWWQSAGYPGPLTQNDLDAAGGLT